MIDLKGKVAVVFGLANKRSIAWGIAQKLSEAGASLAICYQNERLQRDAEELAADLPSARTFQCDVAVDADIDKVFDELKSAYGKLDILVHSIGFAPNIKNTVLQTAREDFRVAHDVSAYSLIALARAAEPLMSEGGSILTLTYYGSTKVFPNYNIMGVAKAALEATVRYLAADLGSKKIRVNAISAGPIKTLAARGIGDFSKILNAVEERGPLHRNVEVAEVGNTALFLSSDLASGITGEVTFVDCGYNITGSLIFTEKTMTIAEVLLQDYDVEISNTRRTLERVPEDKNDFKCHDKSMPLGRLAMHCASMPLFGYYILEDESMDLAAPKRPHVPLVFTTREAALKQLDEAAAQCRASLAAASDEHLQKLWKFTYGEQVICNNSRTLTFRQMFFNHLIHHTAQLGVYLRLNDIPVPALYGPSADEGMGG